MKRRGEKNARKRKDKVSTGSQSQVEQQRRVDEILDAQQREIEALKELIAQMIIAHSQSPSQPPPEDEEDLGRD